MKVKYEGGSAAVTVARVGRVERGGTIEVDDKLGAQLVEQGWKKVGTGSSSSSKKGSRKRSKKGSHKKASTSTAIAPATTTEPPAPPDPDNTPAG